jgi:hypothetical protein
VDDTRFAFIYGDNRPFIEHGALVTDVHLLGAMPDGLDGGFKLHGKQSKTHAQQSSFNASVRPDAG